MWQDCFSANLTALVSECHTVAYSRRWGKLISVGFGSGLWYSMAPPGVLLTYNSAFQDAALARSQTQGGEQSPRMEFASNTFNFFSSECKLYQGKTNCLRKDQAGAMVMYAIGLLFSICKYKNLCSALLSVMCMRIHFSFTLLVCPLLPNGHVTIARSKYREVVSNTWACTIPS